MAKKLEPGGGDWHPAAMSAIRSRLALVAVLAFAALVIGLPAGRTPLWDPNEARYMLLARDILDGGRWLIPDLRGVPYLNKPQLFFWSVAVASIPGGEVTVWTAALPAVVSSIATVAATFAIGARIWGTPAGTMAALALGSTIGFFNIGHHGQSDVMVTAWTWWALYALVVARRAGFTSLPLIAYYACVAAAMMSKGPMGLIALVAGYVAIAATDGPRSMSRLRPLTGLVVLAVLLAPWYATYLSGHGSEFVEDTVVGHYGSWAFRRGALARVESLWVLAHALPWTIFLVAAATWWRRVQDGERRLIIAWTLTIWLLIGLSGIHRARYLIPIYPGVALLVGEFLARAPDRGGARAVRGALLAFAALAGVVAVLALSPVARLIGGEGRPWVPDTRAEMVVMVVLLVTTGLGAVVAARRQAFLAGGLVVALGVGAILVVEGDRYPARFAREFDVRPIAAAASALTPPGTAVRVYPDILLTYDFYLRRPVVELDRPGVEQVLAGTANGAVIMSRKSWMGLQPKAHASWRIVSTQRVGNDEMLVLGSGA
jgi:4-amino-4-deoxy-L-arabinose transferase-like glycosyltransferase